MEEKPKRPTKEIDPLDPATRAAAQLAPPMNASAITTTPKGEEVTARSRISLEELIPQVVRRIAWGGDRVKGTVHVELHSGTTVTVHADGARVRVELGGAGDHAELGRRIESRLRAAGIEVESVR